MQDLDDEMRQWMAAHRGVDPNRLRLSAKGDPGICQAILQLECRAKAARKLPELLTCPTFLFPTALSAEQCTSQDIATLHTRLIGSMEGLRVMDLTAGLGIDAITMARMGATVTAVDIQPGHIHALHHNIHALALDSRITPVCDDSCHYITTLPDDSFDLIFIDPARRDGADSGRRLYSLADTVPDPVALMPQMLRVAPRVAVKASPMLDIKLCASQLTASELNILGTPTDCKELFAIVRREGADDVQVQSLTPGYDTLAYPLSLTGKAPETGYMSPQTGMIIVEPFPAVMKGAPWQELCRRYSLSPVHPATHIFIANDPDKLRGIQARLWRIIYAQGNSDRAIREIRSRWPIANVTTRNYVLSAPELSRRLRVRSGGDIRIIGCRIMEQDAEHLSILVGEPYCPDNR